MNEWATECATHIFPSKNRNSRTLKICPAPSTWMDGVYRVVRWVMRGFDAADSERTVRRESPTCPMLRSDLPRKTVAPNARGRTAIQGISPLDESENAPSHSTASTLFQMAGKNKQHGTVNTIRVGHSAATWCTDDKIRSVSDLCKESSVCNRLHRASTQISQREDTIMFTLYVGPQHTKFHKLPSQQTHSFPTCGKRS